MLSTKLLEAAGNSTQPTYIEDVFSTYLYTGNGSTQTITNGIDLAGKGGLYWWKVRNIADQNYLVDTARGATKWLISNNTGAEQTVTTSGLALNSNGVSFNNNWQEMNLSGNTYASWTFRKQPKFFDVVTYTGDGTNNRIVNHSLGSVPGCIIIKSMGTVTNWMVYHRSLATNYLLTLNSTAAAADYSTVTIHDATSTTFQVDNYSMLNASGVQYVAYIFAHNAGGFGLTGTDNVISCGSFTTDASANASVTLGYEPQFVLYKRSSGASNWFILDNMRGWSQTGYNDLKANLADAENSVSGVYGYPTATGFDFVNSGSLSVSSTYIYIAVRRGPMKVPTDATKVFSPLLSISGVQSTGFPVDLQIANWRTGTNALLKNDVSDRLRGLSSTSTSINISLLTNSTGIEGSGVSSGTLFNNTSYTVDSNFVGSSNIFWNFQRAPGFFDEVCYTGTGNSGTAYNHNLGVTPELIIVKCRSTTGTNWPVYVSGVTGFTNWLPLNLTNALVPSTNQYQGTSTTTFTVGNDSQINGSGRTYVAYLFASCPGVSKIGSYTGTGAAQTINCGFAAGARFVLIKRTDSTGDWYVWDTARGIVSGNDPYLLMNSTAAEVTTTDYIDPVSSGFEISSTAPAAINASGGSYIYLAIA